MLVISGVNATATLGKGLGHLHELPDQRGMMEKVALFSRADRPTPTELPGALAARLRALRTGRPGPVHIEIPLDVMAQPAGELVAAAPTPLPPAPDPAADCGGGAPRSRGARAR